MSNTFLFLSTLVGLITPLVGIVSVLKGEFKPQRTTRLIFLIITSLFVLTLFFQGDRRGIFLAILQWLGSVIFFVLSLKFGVGGKNKSDVFVFLFAILAIIVWKLTSNPTLALYMSILADLIGFSPTLYKSYKHPYTEDWKYYFSDVIAGLFSLLGLTSFAFKDLVFPGYIFMINLVCSMIILYQRRTIQHEHK